MGSIAVLVVDDHRMVAEGLASVLDADPAVTVVGQAGSGEEALRMAGGNPPDVAVVDLGLPGTDGVAVALALQDVAPTIRIVLISAGFTRAKVQEAIAAGVTAFASKLAPAGELVRVVQAAAQGSAYMSSDVVPVVTGSGGQRHGVRALTDRERDVVQGLADGLTVDEMAGAFFLSPHTVRNHIRRAMASLGVHRRLDAVVVAARAGLIRLPE